MMGGQWLRAFIGGLRVKGASRNGDNRGDARENRPWGWYQTVDRGDRFLVKRIALYPGHRFSLQKHHYRSEHWVVVAGVAKVTKDDAEFTLHENQATYIPVGTVHRLENIGTELLELVEVQTGTYLDEGDIVRLTDDYGRVANPSDGDSDPK